MKIWRKTLLFASLFVLVLALAACGGKDEKASTDSEKDGEKATTSALDDIKERGVLRVAVFSDKPPFGYIDENGDNQGYDVVVAKRLAKDLLGDESKVEFVLTEAQNRIDVLKSDKVDITLANFTVTDERAQQVDFANPYMKVAIGLASSKDKSITSIDDLKGKKLIVNKGTTAETYFTENYPEIELVKFDQNTEAFEALKDGRGDAIAHDNTLLFAWAKENPKFTVSIKSIGDLDYIAPAVKKGNTELLDWINEEFEKLGSEKFFGAAYNDALKPVFGDEIKAEDIVVEGKAE